MSTAAQCIWVL